MKDTREALKELAGTIKNPVTFFVVAVFGMARGLTALAGQLSAIVAGWLAVALTLGILASCGFVGLMTVRAPEKLVRAHDPAQQADLLFPVSGIVEDMVLEVLDKHDALQPRLDDSTRGEEVVDAE